MKMDILFSRIPISSGDPGSECPCLFVILIFITVTALALLGVSPLDATGSAATEWRLKAEVDVLLRVKSHNEAGHIHNLLSDSDVTLSDEDTSMMDRLSKSKLEHLGLKTTLQEVLDLETEHVIKHTNTYKTTEKCVTFKQPSVVLLFKGKQGSGGSTDLGQGVLYSPHLTLVTQTILTNKFQLLVESSLLERSPRSGVGLRTVLDNTIIDHC